MDFLQQQRLDDMFFEADALIREKKITEAMSVLEGILIESPDYGKAYNHLGWIHETYYKDFVRSEENYRKCIAYKPEYTPVYTNLSITLSTLGKFKEQEELLANAINVIGIEKAGIYNEMGIMYELQGQYDNAIKHYKIAAQHTLVNLNLETYIGSIDRCKKKKDLMFM